MSTFNPGTSPSPPSKHLNSDLNNNNNNNNNDRCIQQTNTKIKISRSTSSLKVYDPKTNDIREEILEETQTQIKKQQRSSSLAMNHNSIIANRNNHNISPRQLSRQEQQTTSLQLSPVRTQSSFDNISELYSNINVKTPSNPNNQSTNLSYTMNDLITDRIGKDFFTHVLGNKQSPHKHK